VSASENPDRVGEVIAASTTNFVAQCYELYKSPPLGSLVKTRDESVAFYAVVYSATTTSLEPGRRPVARGQDEASEAEIYRQSPQLMKLFRSEFSALVIGHRQGERLYHYLPPQPARIHSFVYLCPTAEVKDFSQSFDFLNILINTPLPISSDELIAAALRQMSQVYEDQRGFLVAAARELAILLSGKLSQLKAILGRIRP
jgi:hypothetical protein